jgi:hypothetical protein
MEIIGDDFSKIRELDLRIQLNVCNNLLDSLDDPSMLHEEFSETLDKIKVIASNLSEGSNYYIRISIDIRNKAIKKIDERIERNVNESNASKYKFKVEMLKLIILIPLLISILYVIFLF